MDVDSDASSSTDTAGQKRSKVDEAASDKEAEVDAGLLVSNFRISPSTAASLEKRGIKALFPIQAATFDAILDGQDMLARARTGTGKTLAFSLPMIERLALDAATPSSHAPASRMPKIIVMAPTRELARQVAAEFESISGSLKVLTVYGGVAYDEQNRGLRQGVDVVIGTPGRIVDHMERGTLRFENIRFVCLDEADQMLDIGFADAMEKVLQCIQEQKAAQANAPTHQTLLFSATLPEWVHKVVRKYLKPDHQM
ncbi:P-loop containing nucleoside triphosphate hydrolase protein, partial [Syncephalis pseudoplumigaleata]